MPVLKRHNKPQVPNSKPVRQEDSQTAGVDRRQGGYTEERDDTELFDTKAASAPCSGTKSLNPDSRTLSLDSKI